MELEHFHIDVFHFFDGESRRGTCLPDEVNRFQAVLWWVCVITHFRLAPDFGNSNNLGAHKSVVLETHRVQLIVQLHGCNSLKRVSTSEVLHHVAWLSLAFRVGIHLGIL